MPGAIVTGTRREPAVRHLSRPLCAIKQVARHFGQALCGDWALSPWPRISAGRSARLRKAIDHALALSFSHTTTPHGTPWYDISSCFGPGKKPSLILRLGLAVELYSEQAESTTRANPESAPLNMKGRWECLRAWHPTIIDLIERDLPAEFCHRSRQCRAPIDREVRTCEFPALGFPYCP